MSRDNSVHNGSAPGSAHASPGPAADPTSEHDDAAYDYDVLVIGSGFGGSVSALRLSEKGYRVGVLEAGRRFTRAE
ncbi:NAD(P)-binding protein, partial [Streptomyces sp. AC627_RSS907]